METVHIIMTMGMYPIETPWVLICLTGFLLLPQYWGMILGSFFYGGISPSKTDLAPPLETQYVSIQKHVLSSYVKISKECFVWASPTALRGGPYLKNEEQHFESLREVRIRTRHV
jgi:hypothetical protein